MPDRQTTIRLDIEVGNIILPAGVALINARLTVAPPSPAAVTSAVAPVAKQIEAMLKKVFGAVLGAEIFSWLGNLKVWLEANAVAVAALVKTLATLAVGIFVIVGAIKLVVAWAHAFVAITKQLAQAFAGLVTGIYKVNAAILGWLAMPFRSTVSASADALMWLVNASGQAASAIYDLTERVLRNAVIVGAAFEQQVANTATAMGKFGDEGMRIRPIIEAAATALTRGTGTMPIEAVKGFWDVVSAGFDKFSDTLHVTRASIALANATLTPLADTVRITTSLIRQFGLETDQADRVVNALAATSVKTATDIPKLMESMKYAGPVAAAFGLSLEETLAAIGTFANQGILASNAGTALRVIMTDLARVTKEGSDAFKIFSPVLKAMGMTAKDISPIYNSLGTILARFEMMMVKLGKSAMMESVVKAFSMRGYSGMLALLNQGGKVLGDMQSEITGTNLAYQMQADQLRTLSGAWKIMLNLWQGAQIQISHGIQPVLAAVVGWFQRLIDLGTSMGIFERLGSVAGKAIAMIVVPLGKLAGPIMQTISKMLDYLGNAFDVFLTALGDMGPALDVAFAAMPDLAPMMQELAAATVKALPSVVSFLAQLPKVAGQVMISLGGVATWFLSTGLPAFIEWATAVGPLMAQVFLNIASAVGQFLQAGGQDRLVTWFSNLLTFAETLTAWLPNMIPFILDAMKAFQGWADTLMAMGSELLPKFWDALVAILPQLDAFVVTYLPILRSELSQVIAVVTDFATNALPKIMDAFKAMQPQIIEVIDSIAGAIRSLGASMGDAVKALADSFPEIARIVERAMKWIANNADDIISKLMWIAELKIYIEGLSTAFKALFVMGPGAAAEIMAATSGAVAAIAQMRKEFNAGAADRAAARANAPGRASGGPVKRGQVYTVGEHGPETFVAPADGVIVPNGGHNRPPAEWTPNAPGYPQSERLRQQLGWVFTSDTRADYQKSIATMRKMMTGTEFEIFMGYVRNMRMGWMIDECNAARERALAANREANQHVNSISSVVYGPAFNPNATTSTYGMPYDYAAANAARGPATGGMSVVSMNSVVAHYARWLTSQIGPKNADSLITRFGAGKFANWAGGNLQPDVTLAVGRAIANAKVYGKRASGGPVVAGQAYTVGERGAETFVPSQNGYIVPNGQSAGGNTLVMSFTDLDSMERAAAAFFAKRRAQEAHIRGTAGASLA